MDINELNKLYFYHKKEINEKMKIFKILNLI
jgi:hypothetical protein